MGIGSVSWRTISNKAILKGLAPYLMLLLRKEMHVQIMEERQHSFQTQFTRADQILQEMGKLYVMCDL